MTSLLPLPFALPLITAAVSLLLRRHRGAQRVLTAALLATLIGIAIAFVVATRNGEVLAVVIGDWPVELGIPFAVDGFAALMQLTVTVSSALALVFAVSRGEDRHAVFHPMVAILIGGVLGAMTTADVFNLFVTFEVMLIGSYVLLTLRGGRRQVRAGTIYVTVSLLASTMFLVGIALLYGTVGTVAFAQLHGIVGTVPEATVGAWLIVGAISVKASLVPLHTYLPRTYVEAAPGVTALFSGLLTKAGVYVLFRLSSILFAGGDSTSHRIWIAVAAVSMVVGVLGAVGRGDMRGILVFHMVSQVGYLILPLGLWSVAGLTAGIVYLMQYVLVKGALFVAVGTVETLTGTGKLKELGGMVRTRPWLAMAFLFPALALAGIPPTSGFVGKYLLIRAAFLDAHWVGGGVAVLVSLFTLLSMVKIWNGAFWGDLTLRSRTEPAANRVGLRPIPAGGADDTDQVPRAPRNARVVGMVAPAMVVAVAVFVLGIGAQPLIELVGPAVDGLLDPTVYVDTVGSL